MARRTTIWPTSLELVLDTVCNTFGCIVLLALLVTLLARQSGSELVQSTEILKLQTEWERQREENRALSEAVTALENQIALLPSAATGLARQEQALRQECRSLAERIGELGRQRETNRQTAEQIRRQLADAKVRLERTKQQLGEHRSKLADGSEEITLSRERENRRKAEIGIVVRFGRMYIWHRYDEHGIRLGLNTDEFLVTGKEHSALVTEPKPYAGILLDAPDAPARIAQRLAQFDPQRHVLTIAVWDDSFAQFAVLRCQAVRLGFEYRLIAVRKGKALADRGGRASFVQ